MQKIYATQNPLLAHMFRAFLEEAGIDATVQDAMQYDPLRGQLPFSMAQRPTVFVVRDEDAPRARELLEEFEKESTQQDDDAPPWRCAGCGELSPPQFGLCWNCGAERPPEKA